MQTARSIFGQFDDCRTKIEGGEVSKTSAQKCAIHISPVNDNSLGVNIGMDVSCQKNRISKRAEREKLRGDIQKALEDAITMRESEESSE